MNCALQGQPKPKATAPLRSQGVQGIDFGWGGPTASWMQSQGYKFGASYLSPDFSKNWPSNLIRSYEKSGISCVFVWESTAQRSLEGYAAGRTDARWAISQAAPFNVRVIYFAVDFDETPGQAPAVASYFRGVDSVLPVSKAGVYGGYYVVKRILDAHLASYAWQTYAWSGGQWDARAQLQQYFNGNTYDLDRSVAKDYGQIPYVIHRTHPHHRELLHLYGARKILRLTLMHEGCVHLHPRSPRCVIWHRDLRRVEGRIAQLHKAHEY